MINQFILLLSMSSYGLTKPYEDIEELEFWQGMMFRANSAKKQIRESVPISSKYLLTLRPMAH